MDDLYNNSLLADKEVKPPSDSAYAVRSNLRADESKFYEDMLADSESSPKSKKIPMLIDNKLLQGGKKRKSKKSRKSRKSKKSKKSRKSRK